jgi:hypothetical protein
MTDPSTSSGVTRSAIKAVAATIPCSRDASVTAVTQEGALPPCAFTTKTRVQPDVAADERRSCSTRWNVSTSSESVPPKGRWWCEAPYASVGARRIASGLVAASAASRATDEAITASVPVAR